MAFFTKKQKRLMRDRKKKKKHATTEGGDDPLAGKKRPRPTETTAEDEFLSSTPKMPPTMSNTIVVPAHLSAKDQKKFRKDARRQARAQGRDENTLSFVVEGTSSKKTKREFPKINDLVQEEKLQKEKEAELQKRQEAYAAVPEHIKSRYLAMDCEMVGIGTTGRQSALARVSVVDWDGNVVLDTFVKVPTRVTDFRTWVSGVKPKDLKRQNAMEENECRETVSAILKGKIAVGHALKNDFSALFITHPKQDIRDTAKYRRFQRFGGNKWRPRKLRDLVKENLGLTIQEEGQSHDSIDDAKAAMELFKLAREEWEKELELKSKKSKNK